jgi:trehalose 6-phosphate synthase/phosphatase
LFLDYDGTLREFEPRPELAVPTKEIEELLAELNVRTDLAPHIISGRDAKFLDEHFSALSRFTLIAEHGFQIRRPGTMSWERLEQASAGPATHWMAPVRAEMYQLVDEVPGSHVEEKASCLVWHYREVADEAFAEKMADTAVERLANLVDRDGIQGVRVARGNKIVEVCQGNVRKGLTMQRLCRDNALLGDPYQKVLVAGDDVTDESMFGAASHDFLTIKVGLGATLARFCVESPDSFRKLLWHIVS